MVLVLPTAVGGHLVELLALASRLPEPLAGRHRHWITWRTAQSTSLLAEEDVTWIDPVEPRDLGAVLRAGAATRRAVAGVPVVAALSTGSAVALGALPALAAAGVPCHFVESATRTTGPSLTGRLLAPVPGVHRYTQHRWAARPGLPFAGSVFDGFERGPDRPVQEVRHAVVSVGTMRGHPFRRLIAAAVAVVPAEAEVLWQTGCTPLDGLTRAGLPLPGRDLVAPEDLAAAMAAAPVVIGHAGVGTALAALSAGRCPVLVPRRGPGPENVDDHQEQLAADLAARGLAVVSGTAPDELRAAVAEAARRSVVRAARVPVLSLRC